MKVDIKKFNRPYDGIDLQKVIEHGSPAETEGRYLSFLLQGQAAHIGTRYKIYREKASADWQMFDILTDPNETKDIASENAVLLNKLIGDVFLGKIG